MNAPIDHIPTPWAERMRSWRRGLAPLMVFAVLCGAIAVVWRDHVHPMTFSGEVEALRARVTVPVDGILADLRIAPQQRVAEGETLAMIFPADARLVEATLGVIRAEIDLIAAGMDPLISRRRADYDHQALQLDLMKQRVEIATARVTQANAEASYLRARHLHATGAGSLAEFEEAEAVRNALLADIAGREEIVRDLEAELSRLLLDGHGPDDSDAADPVAAAIRVQERRLELAEAELAPVILRAPMAGVVGWVDRVAGEHLMAGEELFSIQGDQGERVMAYLRPPLAFEPEVGMEVEIMTRELRPRRFRGEVVAVNPQFEVIPATLLGSTISQAKGLPLLVRIPLDAGVRPGELVDLRLAPAGGRG